MASIEKQYFWAPDKDLVWVAGYSLLQSRAGDSTVRLTLVEDKTKTVEVALNQCMRIVDSTMLTDYPDDFIALAEVNEATILCSSRLRFKEKLIYTSCGSVLMAINPFERIEGLYSSDRMAAYFDPNVEGLLSHVYIVPSRAYAAMCEFGKNQSILVSGESGAGKTEATKQTLAFLANIAGATTVKVPTDTNKRRDSKLIGTKNSAIDIANRIIAASPILESFGNAQTLRNPNSSRFGKWMELNFDSSNHICGSTIVSYLLEKGRVTSPSPGERNYHIFYQILRGMSEIELNQLDMNPVISSYKYLVVDKDLKDVDNYHEMMQSFEEMGFGVEETRSILNTVCGILSLGNVEYDELDDGEASSVAGDGGVNSAKLWSVSTEALRMSLCSRTMTTGAKKNSIVVVKLNPKKAADARDSLSRAIYDRLFKWIIKKMNDKNEVKESTRNIGLLDIFGFEIFENNSFEQLCINYCNEMLQNHFNFVIFTAEKTLYMEENISCDSIEFKDNAEVINNIEITFKDLDEEARIPKGSSKTWFDKLTVKCSKKDGSMNRYSIPQKKDRFLVHHYAGDVGYVPENFLEKNMETLSKDLSDLMASSDNPIIRELFQEEKMEAEKAGGSKTGQAKKTVKSISWNFQNQLTNLMTMLKSSDSHFIRCVKSNDACKPMLFDAKLVQRQLLYSGVFEVVKIQQSGLPFRLKSVDFLRRYRCLLPLELRGKLQKDTDMAAHLKAMYDLPKMQCGRTMVFYKGFEYRTLEMQRNEMQLKYSIVLQGWFRTHSTKKCYKRLLKELGEFDEQIVALNKVLSKDHLVRVEAVITRMCGITGLKVLGRLYLNSRARVDLLVKQIEAVGKLRMSLTEDSLAGITQMEIDLEQMDVVAIKLERNETVLKCKGILKRFNEAKEFANTVNNNNGLGDYTRLQLDERIKALNEFKNYLPESAHLLKVVRERKHAFELELNEILPKLEASIENEAYSINGDGLLQPARPSRSGVKKMKDVIASITFGNLQSGDCRHLYTDCVIFMKIRDSINKKSSGDLDGVMASIDNEKDKIKSVDLQRQMVIFRQHLEIRVAEVLMLSAIENGQVPSTALNNASESDEPLGIATMDEVLDRTEFISNPSKNLKGMRDSATIIMKLREAFQSKDWPLFKEILNDAEELWQKGERSKLYTNALTEFSHCHWQLEHKDMCESILSICQQMPFSKVKVAKENWSVIQDDSSVNSKEILRSRAFMQKSTVLITLHPFTDKLLKLRALVSTRKSMADSIALYVKVSNALLSLTVDETSLKIIRCELALCFTFLDLTRSELDLRECVGSTVFFEKVSSVDEPFVNVFKAGDEKIVRNCMLRLHRAVKKLKTFNMQLPKKLKDDIDVAETIEHGMVQLLTHTFIPDKSIPIINEEEEKNKWIVYLRSLVKVSVADSQAFGFSEYNEIHKEMYRRKCFLDLSNVISQCFIFGTMGDVRVICKDSTRNTYNSLREFITAGNNDVISMSPTLKELLDFVGRLIRLCDAVDRSDWIEANKLTGDCLVWKKQNDNLQSKMTASFSNVEITLNFVKRLTRYIESKAAIKHDLGREFITFSAGINLNLTEVDVLMKSMNMLSSFQPADKESLNMIAASQQVINICGLLGDHSVKDTDLDLHGIQELINNIRTLGIDSANFDMLFTFIYKDQIILTLSSSFDVGPEKVRVELLKIRQSESPKESLLWIKAAESYCGMRSAISSSDTILIYDTVELFRLSIDSLKASTFSGKEFVSRMETEYAKANKKINSSVSILLGTHKDLRSTQDNAINSVLKYKEVLGQVNEVSTLQPVSWCVNQGRMLIDGEILARQKIVMQHVIAEYPHATEDIPKLRMLFALHAVISILDEPSCTPAMLDLPLKDYIQIAEASVVDVEIEYIVKEHTAYFNRSDVVLKVKVLIQKGMDLFNDACYDKQSWDQLYSSNANIISTAVTDPVISEAIKAALDSIRKAREYAWALSLLLYDKCQDHANDIELRSTVVEEKLGDAVWYWLHRLPTLSMPKNMVNDKLDAHLRIYCIQDDSPDYYPVKVMRANRDKSMQFLLTSLDALSHWEYVLLRCFIDGTKTSINDKRQVALGVAVKRPFAFDSETFVQVLAWINSLRSKHQIAPLVHTAGLDALELKSVLLKGNKGKGLSSPTSNSDLAITRDWCDYQGEMLQSVAAICKHNPHSAGVIKLALQRVKTFSSSLACTRLATPLEKFTPKSLHWVKAALLQAHTGAHSDSVSSPQLKQLLKAAGLTPEGAEGEGKGPIGFSDEALKSAKTLSELHELLQTSSWGDWEFSANLLGVSLVKRSDFLMSMDNLTQSMEHVLHSIPAVQPHAHLCSDASVSVVTKLLQSMYSRGTAHPVSDTLSHFMRVCVSLYIVSTANREFCNTTSYLQAMLQALARQLKASGVSKESSEGTDTRKSEGGEGVTHAQLGETLGAELEKIAHELQKSAAQRARQTRMLSVLANRGFYTAGPVRIGDTNKQIVEGIQMQRSEQSELDKGQVTLESTTARMLNLRNTQLRYPGQKLDETGTLLLSLLDDLHGEGIQTLSTSPATKVNPTKVLVLHELAVRTLSDLDAEIIQVATTPGLDLKSDLLTQFAALSKLFRLHNKQDSYSDESDKSAASAGKVESAVTSTRLEQLKGLLTTASRKSAESFELLHAMLSSLLRAGDNSDHPSNLAPFVEIERSRGSPIAAVFEEVYMAISSRFYIQDFLGALEKDRALSCFSLLKTAGSRRRSIMSTGVSAVLATLSDTLDKLHMGYVNACNKVAAGQYENAYEQYGGLISALDNVLSSSLTLVPSTYLDKQAAIATLTRWRDTLIRFHLGCFVLLYRHGLVRALDSISVATIQSEASYRFNSPFLYSFNPRFDRDLLEKQIAELKRALAFGDNLSDESSALLSSQEIVHRAKIVLRLRQFLFTEFKILRKPVNVPALNLNLNNKQLDRGNKAKGKPGTSPPAAPAYAVAETAAQKLWAITRLWYTNVPHPDTGYGADEVRAVLSYYLGDHIEQRCHELREQTVVNTKEKRDGVVSLLHNAFNSRGFMRSADTTAAINSAMVQLNRYLVRTHSAPWAGEALTDAEHGGRAYSAEQMGMLTIMKGCLLHAEQGFEQSQITYDDERIATSLTHLCVEAFGANPKEEEGEEALEDLARSDLSFEVLRRFEQFFRTDGDQVWLRGSPEFQYYKSLYQAHAGAKLRTLACRAGLGYHYRVFESPRLSHYLRDNFRGKEAELSELSEEKLELLDSCFGKIDAIMATPPEEGSSGIAGHAHSVDSFIAMDARFRTPMEIQSILRAVDAATRAKNDKNARDHSKAAKTNQNQKQKVQAHTHTQLRGDHYLRELQEEPELIRGLSRSHMGLDTHTRFGKFLDNESQFFVLKDVLQELGNIPSLAHCSCRTEVSVVLSESYSRLFVLSSHLNPGLSLIPGIRKAVDWNLSTRLAILSEDWDQFETGKKEFVTRMFSHSDAGSGNNMHFIYSSASAICQLGGVVMAHSQLVERIETEFATELPEGERRRRIRRKNRKNNKNMGKNRDKERKSKSKGASSTDNADNGAGAYGALRDLRDGESDNDNDNDTYNEASLGYFRFVDLKALKQDLQEVNSCELQTQELLMLKDTGEFVLAVVGAINQNNWLDPSVYKDSLQSQPGLVVPRNGRCVKAHLLEWVSLRARVTPTKQVLNEITRIEKDCENKLIQHQLLQGLRSGREYLQHSLQQHNNIDTSALEHLVSSASSVHHRSIYNDHLLNLAKSILRMRQAVKAGNWTVIRGVLGETYDTSSFRVPTDVMTELDSLRALSVANQAMHLEVITALKSNCVVTGVRTSGIKLNTDNVNVTTLLTMLRAHHKAPRISPEDRHLWYSLKKIKILRVTLLMRDFHLLIEEMSYIKASLIHEAGIAEVYVIKRAIEFYQILDHVRYYVKHSGMEDANSHNSQSQALSHSYSQRRLGLGGHVAEYKANSHSSSFAFEDVDTLHLANALSTLDTESCTGITKDFLCAAAHILALRMAVKDDQWSVDTLADILISQHSTSQSDKMSNMDSTQKNKMSTADLLAEERERHIVVDVRAVDISMEIFGVSDYSLESQMSHTSHTFNTYQGDSANSAVPRIGMAIKHAGDKNDKDRTNDNNGDNGERDSEFELEYEDHFNRYLHLTKALKNPVFPKHSVPFQLVQLAHGVNGGSAGSTTAGVLLECEKEVVAVRDELYHRVSVNLLKRCLHFSAAPMEDSLSSDQEDQDLDEDETWGANEGKKNQDKDKDKDKDKHRSALTHAHRQLANAEVEIDDAIKVVKHLGVKSPESRTLLHTALFMRSLRSSYSAGNIQNTMTLLGMVEGLQNGGSFDVCAIDEVEHVFRTICGDSVTGEIEAALRGIGPSSTNDDFVALKRVVRRANAVGANTEEIYRLLEICGTILSVHEAFKSGVLHRVRVGLLEAEEVQASFVYEERSAIAILAMQCLQQTVDAAQGFVQEQAHLLQYAEGHASHAPAALYTDSYSTLTGSCLDSPGRSPSSPSPHQHQYPQSPPENTFGVIGLESSVSDRRSIQKSNLSNSPYSKGDQPNGPKTMVYRCVSIVETLSAVLEAHPDATSIGVHRNGLFHELLDKLVLSVQRNGGTENSAAVCVATLLKCPLLVQEGQEAQVHSRFKKVFQRRLQGQGQGAYENAKDDDDPKIDLPVPMLELALEVLERFCPQKEEEDDEVEEEGEDSADEDLSMSMPNSQYNNMNRKNSNSNSNRMSRNENESGPDLSTGTELPVMRMRKSVHARYASSAVHLGTFLNAFKLLMHRQGNNSKEMVAICLRMLKDVSHLLRPDHYAFSVNTLR